MFFVLLQCICHNGMSWKKKSVEDYLYLKIKENIDQRIDFIYVTKLLIQYHFYDTMCMVSSKKKYE